MFYLSRLYFGNLSFVNTSKIIPPQPTNTTQKLFNDSRYAVHMKNLATKAQRHKIFTKFMFFLVKLLCLRVFVANLSFLCNVS